MDVKLDMTYFMSDVAALAIMAFTPFVAATKEIAVDAKISDGSSGELVWRYEQPLRGGALTSEWAMVKLVKDKIIKRYPYRL